MLIKYDVDLINGIRENVDQLWCWSIMMLIKYDVDQDFLCWPWTLMTIMMILLRIYYIDDYDVGQLGMTFDDDAGDYDVDKKFQWLWLW